MEIQPISPDDLKIFSHFSEKDRLNTILEKYVQNLWSQKTSRPEWCFVWREEGQIIGRIIFWSLPSSPFPTDVDFLDVPWNGKYLDVGVHLLQQTLQQFFAQGVEQIKYQLNIPAILLLEPEKQQEILKHVGFSLRREGDRWQLDDLVSYPINQKLVYRAACEFSAKEVTSILQQTLQQSLDKGIQQDITKWGLVEAARKRLEQSKALQYQPDWWQIAYIANNDLVGLIMVSSNDGGPIIDYMGVVPEQRGNGYGKDLLIKGVTMLQADRAIRIRSDSDKNNIPMAQAFLKAGFRRFSTRLVYRIDMSTLRH